MGEIRRTEAHEAAWRRVMRRWSAAAEHRPHGRTAQHRLAASNPAGAAGGEALSFRGFAVGCAALGVLILGLSAGAATAHASQVRADQPAAVQADPPAPRAPDRAGPATGEPGAPARAGTRAAPPSVRVHGIENPAARAVATAVLNTVAREVDERLAPLPTALYLEATTCGPAAQHLAYWDSNRATIGLCSELIEDLQEAEQIHRELNEKRHLYARENQLLISRYVNYEAAQGILFIAYHELGHALVDIYGIEIEGNEEIAVDGFATWWAMEGDAAKTAVQGAMTFDQFGLIEHENPFVQYSELHGPSADRYRNIACWLVGAGVDVPDYFVDDVGGADAPGCQDEYRDLAATWTHLLSGRLLSMGSKL